MAPCIADQKTAVGVNASNALNLNSIRKAIPSKAFEKSFIKSLSYMIFDYIMWGSCVMLMLTLSKSEIYNNMHIVLQLACNILYFNVAGFFMWCIFMIGHDCGHTNFCNSVLVNDIFGHITHGSLLVPYWPWQLSHRRHHMYHNHVEKDYSHPWYTPDRLERPDEGLARMMHEQHWLRAIFPFYGWHIYLYGMPDGSHYFPFTSTRLWNDAVFIERAKCVFSTLVVIAYAAAFYYLFDSNFQTFAFYYLGPFVMFGWWLVTVTYLQHHDHDTLVYDDHDWKFVEAAFETVDRTFGYGIDTLHHHITDGHVAHHLFFTKIPHYNLPIATAAIKKYLAENDLSYMYKHDDTRDFFYRVHKYFVQFGFKATRAPVNGRRGMFEKKKE